MRCTPILLVTLALAAPCLAEDGAGRYLFGASAGAALPMAPEEFSDGFDLELAVTGHFVGPITDWLSWRAEVGQDRFRCSDDVCGDEDFDLRVNRYAGGLQLSAKLGAARVQPYGFALIAAMDGDPSEGESSTELGWSFGGGVNVLVGETWGLGADLHLNAATQPDDRDTLWWVVPSGVVFFRF